MSLNFTAIIHDDVKMSKREKKPDVTVTETSQYEQSIMIDQDSERKWNSSMLKYTNPPLLSIQEDRCIVYRYNNFEISRIPVRKPSQTKQ